ncbi:MAG TPA: FAD-dependent thymidylate synthase [Abditibacteriaceae bacterium]|jgi:thymidylate synthase ThyX
MYQAKILADSIAPCGKRLTTFEVTYPRFVHSELMTHRMFSRNSASSRAIPIEKMIQRVVDDPAMPVYWGANQKGMQAEQELSEEEKKVAIQEWLNARNDAICRVRWLMKVNVHKQIVNRLLEPWMWITVIVSATEYENFFHLRCHPAAQPEIRHIAEMMQELYRFNTPNELHHGQWHLPLTNDYDRAELGLGTPTPAYAATEKLMKVSVGRCARVSYLTHDGKRDLQADIDLCERLAQSGHWSPFEHVAQALDTARWAGNFCGWTQYRKLFQNENFTGGTNGD